MLVSVTLISLFLILYITRVALGGIKAFPGPPGIRLYVYLPILIVHIGLSILSVPPVVYNLLIGLTYASADIPRTKHPQVGRIANPCGRSAWHWGSSCTCCSTSCTKRTFDTSTEA